MNLKSIEGIEFGFDIETIPNKSMVEHLPELKLKLGSLENPIIADLTKIGNTTDPDKIKKKQKQIAEKAKEKEEERLVAIEEKKRDAKQKQIDDMALNPFYSRICSYAIYGNEGRISKYKVLPEINDTEEMILISEIFQDFANTTTEAPTIITWNGTEFDMRFLYTRAVILNIPLLQGVLPYSQMCKRYDYTNHIDLMTVLNKWGTYSSLNEASKVILGEQKLDHDFTKFVELIESDQGDVIGEYNLKDAELTYKLYKRAQPLFLDN